MRSRGAGVLVALLLVTGCGGDPEEDTVTATRAEQRTELLAHLEAGQAAVGQDYEVDDSAEELPCDTDGGGDGATFLLSRTTTTAPADPDGALAAVRRAWQERGLQVDGDERGGGELRTLRARIPAGGTMTFGLGPGGSYFSAETSCTTS